MFQGRNLSCLYQFGLLSIWGLGLADHSLCFLDGWERDVWGNKNGEDVGWKWGLGIKLCHNCLLLCWEKIMVPHACFFDMFWVHVCFLIFFEWSYVFCLPHLWIPVILEIYYIVLFRRLVASQTRPNIFKKRHWRQHINSHEVVVFAKNFRLWTLCFKNPRSSPKSTKQRKKERNKQQLSFRLPKPVIRKKKKFQKK